MLATRAHDLLGRVKLLGRPAFDRILEAAEEGVAEGGYNVVTFRRMRGSQFRFGRNAKPSRSLRVVYIKPLQYNRVVVLPVGVAIPPKVPGTWYIQRKVGDGFNVYVSKTDRAKTLTPAQTAALTQALVDVRTDQTVESIDADFVSRVTTIFGYKSAVPQEAIDAEKLLRRKGVPEDFNQYNLYYDNQGNRLAVRSDLGDLDQFIRTKAGQLRSEDVKEIIAQVILAVHNMHSRGVVHRDIKPENFLVFFRDGKYHVKSTDHDKAIEVNTATGLPLVAPTDIFGTTELMSPELLTVYNGANRNSPRAQREQALATHAGLNFNAIDCYAMGQTIKEIGGLLPPNLRNKPEFTRLHKALMREDVSQRITAEKAMGYTFFGDNPIKRTAFFDKLRARARACNLKVDGYSHLPVEPEDPFYILDHGIKMIHCAGSRAADIAEQIAVCNQTIATGCAVGGFSEIMAKFSFVNQCTKRLAAITVTAESAQNYVADLKAVKQAAVTETKDVFLKLIKDKRAMAVMLKKAVDEAYTDYVTVNKLEDADGEPITHCFDFFMRHGQQGRTQAKAIKGLVNAAFERNAGPKEIFDLIHRHHFHAGGNLHTHSFKTMLLDKLHKISSYTIDGWKQYFDAIDGPRDLNQLAQAAMV